VHTVVVIGEEDFERLTVTPARRTEYVGVVAWWALGIIADPERLNGASRRGSDGRDPVDVQDAVGRP
jgi:hypothetical protein